MSKLDLIETILGRRSIRRYEVRPVENEKIEILIRCACAAPSAANSQPVHFLVVTERSDLDRMASLMEYGKMLNNAPLAILVCGEVEKNDISRLYWQQDASAAMENLLLAAHSLDLGAVWLGVHPNEEREKCLRPLFAISDNISILGIASIGYPAEEKESHGEIREDCLHLSKW